MNNKSSLGTQPTAVPTCIITAVGTSLFTQYPRHCAAEKKDDYNAFLKEVNIGSDLDPIPSEKWKNIISSSLDWSKCAELNSTLEYVKYHKISDYSVRLISSDTPAAKLAADIIHEFLKSKNIPVVLLISTNLTYDGTDRFARLGFPSLISNVKLSIDKALIDGYIPVLNATPGYKAETSLMTLMGAITDTEVFYMHQQMDRPFRLPAMPVSLSADVWKRWRSLVSAVKAKDRSGSGLMSAEEFSAYVDQQYLKDGDFFFEEYDNGIMLSTLGHIFFEAYYGHLPEIELSKSEIPVEKRINITKLAHHFPKGTLDTAKQLASLDFVERVGTKEFRDSVAIRVLARFNKENPGEIFVQWADDSKAVILPVHTTARNELEHSTARQNIEEALELQAIEHEKPFLKPQSVLKSNQLHLLDRLADYGDQLHDKLSKIQSLEEQLTRSQLVIEDLKRVETLPPADKGSSPSDTREGKSLLGRVLNFFR
jgi:putative CRISPR-associated protein (TIGR02619 family)